MVIGPASTFTGVGADMLPALRTVGGAASLTNVDALCGPAGRLSALETVAGTLTLQNRRPEAPLGATGATHLTVGGLAMSATTSLRIPFHADVHVAGAGPVSFDGNANLCPCQIDAFTAALSASGWSGVPVTGGNGGSASCGVCPAPACP